MSSWQQARFRSSVVGAGNSFASVRLSSRYSLPGADFFLMYTHTYRHIFMCVLPLSHTNIYPPLPLRNPPTNQTQTPQNATAGLISESSDGITYMQNLDALIEQAEKDWPKLQVTHSHLCL